MKILVIEDDNSQLYRYKQQLEMNDDVEVIGFNSVEKMLSEVNDLNDFELIISDMNLGKKRKNGLEFLKDINNSKNYEGKMVLLTGEGGLGVRKETWFKNIDYLEKKIDVIDEIEDKYIL